MDVVTYALLSGKVSGVESMVTSLAEGFTYKGSESSVSALPDDADAGDLYTVDGKKYVWDGTNWVQVIDYELDDDLNTAGAAADAKAVGDALATKVPTTRKVNNKALSSNITLAAGDIGYDGTAEYSSGTVGNEVSALKTAITQLEDVVVVSPTEPTSETNKIWVDSDADSVQVPTMEDLWDILPNVTLTNQSIASFNDGANAAVKSLVIDIESEQGGTGFTAVNITRTGKNLCSPTFQNGYYDINNNGIFVSASNWRASEKFKCLPNTKYAMSGSSYGEGGTDGRIIYWDKNNNYIGYNTNAGGNIFTTLQNAEWCAFYIGSPYLTNSMQIEKGTASSFEVYKGTTYQITFPTEAGTVTEGEIDILNGKLIVGSTEYDIDNVPTIETLSEINYIWADTGSINSITYRADIQKYIENVLAST